MSHNDLLNHLLEALAPHFANPEQVIRSGQPMRVSANNITIGDEAYAVKCTDSWELEYLATWVYHPDLNLLFKIQDPNTISITNGDYILCKDNQTYKIEPSLPLHALTPCTIEDPDWLNRLDQFKYAYIQKNNERLILRILSKDQLLCHMTLTRPVSFCIKQNKTHLQHYTDHYGHRSITVIEYDELKLGMHFQSTEDTYTGYTPFKKGIFHTAVTDGFIPTATKPWTLWFNFKLGNEPLSFCRHDNQTLIQHPTKKTKPSIMPESPTWLDDVFQTLEGTFTLQQTPPPENKLVFLSGRLSQGAQRTIDLLINLQNNPKPFNINRTNGAFTLNGNPIPKLNSFKQLINIYHDLNPHGPKLDTMFINGLVALMQHTLMNPYIYVANKKHFVTLNDDPVSQFIIEHIWLMFYRHNSMLYVYDPSHFPIKAYPFHPSLLSEKKAANIYAQLIDLTKNDRCLNETHFFNASKRCYQALPFESFDHHLLQRETYRFIQKTASSENASIMALKTKPLRLTCNLEILDFEDPLTQADLKMLCKLDAYRDFIEKLHGLNAIKPLTPLQVKHIDHKPMVTLALNTDNKPATSEGLSLLLPHEYTHYQTGFSKRYTQYNNLLITLPIGMTLGLVLNHYGILTQSALIMGLLGFNAVSFLALQYVIFSSTDFHQTLLKTCLLPQTCASPWLYYNGIVLALGIITYGITMTNPLLSLISMTILMTLAPLGTHHHLMHHQQKTIEGIFKNNFSASGLNEHPLKPKP